MKKNNPLRPAAADGLRRQKLLGSATLIAAAVAGTCAVPASALAQVMRLDPAIGAEVTVSNNGNQAVPGEEQADVALELRPELMITYDTARLKARGVLGLLATTYIGGERTGTLYPQVDLAATLQAIRDFFYVDADVVATRQVANPFAPRSTSGDDNAYASYAYRIAPYFRGTLPWGRTSYLLRNEFAWSHGSGEAVRGAFNDNGFEWRVRGEVASQGERFGVTYQYQRDYLKPSDEPEYIIELGRAIASYAVTPEFSVNARAGYEWEIFPFSEGQGAIYGAGFSWRPTPRTDVTGWWEERFFGASWEADVSHRTPFFAVSLNSSRYLSTGTQNLLTVPRGNDVFTSLDAILTTRIPDPLDRASAVRDLMLLTGLPSTLAQPVPIYSARVDLQQRHSLSLGLLGARNTLVADAYYLSRQGITATGEPLPPVLALFTDEVQRGASLTYSRELTRNDSLNTTLLWERTEGLLLASEAQSTQWTARIQYNHQFRPRTLGYAGVRYIVYDSNVFNDFNEAAAFVGLYHRF